MQHIRSTVGAIAAAAALLAGCADNPTSMVGPARSGATAHSLGTSVQVDAATNDGTVVIGSIAALSVSGGVITPITNISFFDGNSGSFTVPTGAALWLTTHMNPGAVFDFWSFGGTNDVSDTLKVAAGSIQSLYTAHGRHGSGGF
jgi:hypothetical protein